MKKGTLAATALAVGAGASASTASAQEDEEEEDTGTDGDGEVVVNGQDYYPDADFDILSELDSGTRDDILESETYSDEFDSPGDWEAYAVNFDVGSAGSLGYVFVEEGDADLSAGDTATMDTDASFRNAELNLLEVGVMTGGGGATDDEPPEDEPTDEEDEPTDEEDEPTDDGMDDGATDDGATDDGATDDGATDDGAADDGTTDDGESDDDGGILG